MSSSLIIIIISVLWVSIIVCVPLSDNQIQDNILDIRKRSTGYPSSDVGNLVSNYSRNNGNRAEELGSYYEGDILHIPKAPKIFKRNGINDLNARWPGGVIPYVVNGNFRYEDWVMLNNAFRQYHTSTCIRFVPRTNQWDYISIENSRTGCWSSIGRMGGRQVVNLQSPNCFWIDTVVHELMHAVGFAHEHSRIDRDQYIRILWENVIPSQENNFRISGGTNPYGMSYDYKSVMHYTNKAFSKNGRDTLESWRPGILFSNQFGLTSLDVWKIRRLYQCLNI